MENSLERIGEQVKKVDLSKVSVSLLEAVKEIAVYDTKIRDSSLEYFYLPRLEQIEAVSSMKIEGTQTTMNDIIASDVFPDPKNSEILEVANHNDALLKGARAVALEGFTPQNIKELHKTMLTDIKHKNKEASLGEYKKKDNKIVNNSKTVVYYPPHAEEVEEYMNDLIAFMNSSNYVYHPLINAALIHAQFESIHPFDDGNGRVGRMLIPLYLYKTGVIGGPIFYISEAIEKDKIQYYRNLTNSRSGDMNLWINYFLQKCVDQAKKHITYYQNLEKIHTKVTKVIKDGLNTQRSIDLINALFRYPQLTVNKLSEELRISRTQASRYLQELESLGILYSDDKQRNKSYYFDQYIRLLVQ